MKTDRDCLTYLEILGLDLLESINVRIINKQYRNLSKIYHPDVSDDSFKTGANFKRILEARDYLLANVDQANKVLQNKDIILNAQEPNNSLLNDELLRQYYQSESYQNIQEEIKKAHRRRAIWEAVRTVFSIIFYIIIIIFGGRKD